MPHGWTAEPPNAPACLCPYLWFLLHLTDVVCPANACLFCSGLHGLLGKELHHAIDCWGVDHPVDKLRDAPVPCATAVGLETPLADAWASARRHRAALLYLSSLAGLSRWPGLPLGEHAAASVGPAHDQRSGKHRSCALAGCSADYAAADACLRPSMHELVKEAPTGA